MPRNSQGIYTLATGNPVQENTLIEAGWANATLADLALEISNSLDRQGRGGMLAPFKNADGALATPGMTFTNEPATGIARTGTGEVSHIVGGVAKMKVGVDAVEFIAPPTFASQPDSDAKLANKIYVDTKIAAHQSVANATTAVNAGHATTAGSATSATSATTAGHATTAGSASSVPWTGVSGRPTNLSQFSNDLGYVRAASSPVFTGTVRANGGGLGLGRIGVTNVTGTPVGTSAGDITFVY